MGAQQLCSLISHLFKNSLSPPKSARCMFRQSPFILMSFIVASAVVPYAAFNGHQPDDLETCCLDTPCDALPPCPCYDFANYSLSAEIYVESYRDTCTALGVFSENATDAAENAAFACRGLFELSSFRTTALLLFLIGALGFLSVYVARKSPIRHVNENAPSLFKSVKQTLGTMLLGTMLPLCT